MRKIYSCGLNSLTFIRLFFCVDAVFCRSVFCFVDCYMIVLFDLYFITFAKFQRQGLGIVIDHNV